MFQPTALRKAASKIVNKQCVLGEKYPRGGTGASFLREYENLVFEETLNSREIQNIEMLLPFPDIECTL